MHISEFSVKNPVLMNLLMAGIIVVGLLTAFRLPLELFPSIQLELVTVTTIYPGASAEDVEQLVTIAVEDELSDIEGVKVVRSTSSEGRSYVVAELEAGEDIQKVAQDVRSDISQIRNKLPDDIEEPLISEQKASFPIISVSIAGEVKRELLRKFALDLRDDLELIKGVDNVVTSGLGDPVFWIRVNPAQLRQYDISIEDISATINNKNLDFPGGSFKQQDLEYLVRSKGRIQSVADIEDLPVKVSTSGKHIYLKDIASIELGEEKTISTSRINSLPAISFWVNKRKNADVVETAKRIEQKVEQFRKSLPDEIDIFLANDNSYWVKQRLKTMVISGIVGLIIVLILLNTFLDRRSAIVVAAGLPVSFFGAFIVMSFTGVTINLLSMFAMILVLGIIVDDAIIVAENIQRYIQNGLSPARAAVVGTKEVALPVIATILTNIASFVPLLLASGIIGKFLSIIPKVAIFALLVSLIEALLILPTHCSDYLRAIPKKRSKNRGMVYKMRSYYLKALAFVLYKRYIVLGSSIVILVMSIAVYVQIPPVLFHTKDIAQFIVRVENPTRSSLGSTKESVKKVESVIKENIPPHVLKNVFSMIGIDISQKVPEFGDHVASILVEYEDFEKRKENGKDLMKLVKNKSQDVIGPNIIKFIQTEGPPTGDPVDIEIQGDDFNVLKDLSADIKKELDNMPGVYGVSDNLVWGKPEIRLIVDEKKAAIYGLNNTTVSRAVRAAIDGLTVSRTRIGSEEADIIVKQDLPTNDIEYILKTYEISNGRGSWVPLSNIVDFEMSPSMLSISRYDMERAVRVTAEIDQDVSTSSEVNIQLQNFIKTMISKLPGYSYKVGGEDEETRESIDSIINAIVVSAILIYLILATILKSYLQPFIIMSVLPYTIIGVLFGVLLRGEPVSLPALIGFVALLGVVVNDSLVLMDFINKRVKNMNKVVAVFMAAKHRFRPIVLTTITTFGGLALLMTKTRGESAFLAPMAIALGFGLVFATLITLFLIPALYLILDDIKKYVGIKIEDYKDKRKLEIPTS
ncbi:MAG TPA: efflux RND transporter permease subunit [Thermodesulfobacteriota bacterium]|nr:efflux RND transporter permease subunit [Thermodesulfobacteriota bacterium]